MSNRCSISKLPSSLNNKNLFNTLNHESQLLSNNTILEFNNLMMIAGKPECKIVG